MRRLAALALLGAACAPAEVSPAGARVAVRAAPPPGCASLGRVEASAGYNGRSDEANAAGVEASLRNDAAGRGGDTIVIRERRRGAVPVDPRAPRAGMTSGGCPACVAMTAEVFRCAEVDPFAAAAEAALAAALESARACVPAASAPREARVKVTFAPSGDVVYAEALGEGLEGTEAGACVARKLRNGHVPPFAGAPRSVEKSARLAP